MATKKKRNKQESAKDVVATSTPAAPAHAGSEREADQQREGGPRDHGSDWQQATEDEEHGRRAVAESADTRTEHEAADDEIADPGTRGAVFGRGGTGLVERDEPDDPAGPALEREQHRHGSRSAD
jgi:hypothetical protein